jgi:hypothetical protein
MFFTNYTFILLQITLLFFYKLHFYSFTNYTFILLQNCDYVFLCLYLVLLYFIKLDTNYISILASQKNFEDFPASVGLEIISVELFISRG